jgi:hypothetical protein
MGICILFDHRQENAHAGRIDGRDFKIVTTIRLPTPRSTLELWIDFLVKIVATYHCQYRTYVRTEYGMWKAFNAK